MAAKIVFPCQIEEQDDRLCQRRLEQRLLCGGRDRNPVIPENFLDPVGVGFQSARRDADLSERYSFIPV